MSDEPIRLTRRLECRRTKGGPVPFRRIAVMSIVLLLAFLAAGCSEEGEGPISIPGDGSGTSPTSPEATQPPETQPPETTQAPDTTEAPVDESEGVPTEAVVVILLGIVLLAILVGVLIGRNRSSSADSDGSANGQE